jgi:enterochelin esterase family protein
MFVLVFTLISKGCGSDTDAPEPTCTQEGVVLSGQHDSPTRGAPIRYQIYLPPCYEQQTEEAYPVLYLIHPARSLESSWNNQGAADIANRLIHSGDIPPFILVTPLITHSDYTIPEVVNDLLPEIDAQYRTLKERRFRAIGGASFGGYVSLFVTAQNPDVFGSAGIFSAGVMKKDEPQIREWLAGFPSEAKPRFLIDVGEQDGSMQAVAERLIELLERYDIPYTLVMESGGHDWDYWSAHLEMYLRWFAQSW